jgi:outer membrane lipoprotein SlyB
MENTNSRLHPLLTAAAISVTVFSAVGVASLTGFLPHSFGSQKEVAPLQIPQEVAKPVEPAITHPVQEPVAKPVHKKPVARVSRPQAMAPAPVAYSDFGHEPPLAQAPVTVPEAPRPVVKPGNVGTIQAVREVKDPGKTNGVGPIAGGIAGAILGDQIGGHGNTRKIITVLGAAGGAFAGREIEQQARATKHWEIDVRRDDGATETVRSDVTPPYHPGDRVRLLDGRLQPV